LLTEAEIERLIAAAKDNRYGHRDATAILVAYRHGLRPIELVDLRWDDIDFTLELMCVRRTKRGETTVHPITVTELWALRLLRKQNVPERHVFISERGAPWCVAGYQRMIARAGEAAGFPLLVDPRMLPQLDQFAAKNK
jgi:integrase